LFGNANRWNGWRQKGNSAFTLTADFGNRWIRCVIRTTWKIYGIRAKPDRKYSATITIANSDTLSSTTTITDNSGGTITISGGPPKVHRGSGIVNNSGATISGYGTIDGAVSGTGSVTASGGVLEFSGNESAQIAFDIANVATSDLTFDGSVGTSSIHPTITFDGTNSGAGILDLTAEGKGTSSGEPTKFHGTVSNFAVGDEILVRGTSGDTVSHSGGVLTVLNGSTVEETITVNGSAGYFHISTSGSGSHTVDTITTTAICFYPGTLVRTPEGEVAVETLKRGDLVLTSNGEAKPACWLGRQTISTVFADPLRV
jgi:hypothetical protein